MVEVVLQQVDDRTNSDMVTVSGRTGMVFAVVHVGMFYVPGAADYGDLYRRMSAGERIVATIEEKGDGDGN